MVIYIYYEQMTVTFNKKILTMMTVIARWAWPASQRGDGLQPYLAFVLAAEKHAAPIRLQTAYIT